MEPVDVRRLKQEPERCVTAADVVMGGDVLRIVLSGLPELKASNPVEALQELRREHDDFRRFVIEHPRGNEAINGCLLLPPFSPEAVRTIVVAPQVGYVPIAGTPLMAAAAALVELGEVGVQDPITRVRFDTAKGLAEIEVMVEGEHCSSTHWRTTRARVTAIEKPMTLETGRTVAVSVVSPGLPYGVVRAADLDVDFEDMAALGAAGSAVAGALRTQLSPESIGMGDEARDYFVMVVGEMSNQDPCSASVEVACVSPNGFVWATPAGTGAISVATYLNELGELANGDWLETVTPAGNRFRCRVDEESATVEATAEIVALTTLIGVGSAA